MNRFLWDPSSRESLQHWFNKHLLRNISLGFCLLVWSFQPNAFMQLSLKAVQTTQKPESLNPQRLTEMEEILHTLVFLFDFHAVAQGPAVVLKRPSTAQSCCGQKFSARGESLVQFVPVVLKTRGGNHHCSNRVSQGGLTLQLTLRATQKRTFCAAARIRGTTAKTKYHCKNHLVLFLL